MHELLQNQLMALATVHAQRAGSFERLTKELEKKAAEVERLSQKILEIQEQSERAIVQFTKDLDDEDV